MHALRRATAATRTCEGRSAPGEGTSGSSEARRETTIVRSRRKCCSVVFRASVEAGTRREPGQHRRPGRSCGVGRVV
jgi:hypothetical protein